MTKPKTVKKSKNIEWHISIADSYVEWEYTIKMTGKLSIDEIAQKVAEEFNGKIIDSRIRSRSTSKEARQ